jgi:hypothetical protein
VHEGRSVVYVARQMSHDAERTPERWKVLAARETGTIATLAV